MNLKTFIDETLRDLEEDQKRLSVMLSRCLRISNHLQDFDDIMWFTYNIHDFEDVAENDNLRKELYVGLLKKYGKDESKIHWENLIKEYSRARTIESVKDNDGHIVTKGGLVGLSVSSLENRIDMLIESQKNNTIPDGLHSLDLYFKDNAKRNLDFILQNQININKDILSKINNKTYNILIKYEQLDLVAQNKKDVSVDNSEKVFIIHGHNESKWRELQTILEKDFNLSPIVLQQQPDSGKTIIEKFEYYAEQCCYAFAIFTPDDVVEKDGVKYFQARPNVIYELGWFCAYLGRSRVCIVFQEGANMEIFSDFQGVIQKKFYKNISEIFRQIKLELQDLSII